MARETHFTHRLTCLFAINVSPAASRRQPPPVFSPFFRHFLFYRKLFILVPLAPCF